MDIEKKIVDIQDRLKKMGYERKSIDYQELQILHQRYGKDMDEKTFSQEVLQLSYGSYMVVRNSGKKSIILKKKVNREINQEIVLEIQEELKRDGYIGQKIYYEELKEIHQKYGRNMPEQVFAQEILELSYGNYKTSKQQKCRVKILKTVLKSKIEKSIIQIQEELRNEGYVAKRISYEEFQKLHQKYAEDIKEEDFAKEILLMPMGQFNNMKNKGKKVCILGKLIRDIDNEEIEEIQEQLKKLGYVGRLIDYQELQKLYKNYGKDIGERVFAKSILRLSDWKYEQMKYKMAKVIILSDLLEDKEKIKKTQEELKKLGYVGRLIDYQELQRLHKEHGIDMKEIEFSLQVLQLTNKNYNNIVNGIKTRIKVLRNEEESKVSDKDNLKCALRKEGLTMKLITYEDLQGLHRKYANGISEKRFAEEILEITKFNYYSAKNKGSKVRILCSRKRIENIRKTYLKESRFYSKEEIESICEKNNISINEFINLILSSYSKYSRQYEELINQGKIWIGRTEMTNEFVRDNFDRMQKLAQQAMIDIKGKYRLNYNRDEDEFMQEAILYIINNRGDIERNFQRKETAMNMQLYTSIRKYIKYRVLEEMEIQHKIVSLDQSIYKGANGEKNTLAYKIQSLDSTEKGAIEKIQEQDTEGKEFNLAEQCIEELKKQIEAGKSKEVALKNTSKKLNIGREDMLHAMESYLTTKGRIKTRPKKEKIKSNEEQR